MLDNYLEVKENGGNFDNGLTEEFVQNHLFYAVEATLDAKR